MAKNLGTKTLLLSGDLLLLYMALGLTLLLRYWGNDPDWELIRQHPLPFTLTYLVWLLIFGAFGLYDLRFVKNSKRFLYRLLRAMGANTTIAILIFYLVPFFEIEPRRNLFLLVFLATVLIFLWRYFFNILNLKTAASRVLFFGINKDVRSLVDYLLKNPQLRQKPVAFMSSEEYTSPRTLPLPHFTAQQHLAHLVRDFNIDTIAISREIKENKTLVSALFEVIPLGVAVIEFPAFFEMLTGKIPLLLIGEVWFLENLAGARKQFYEFFKRAIDLLLAVILGALGAMLFPFIALAIKLDSRGPLFFRQKRIGRHGKPFWLIKYRSMVKDAERMSGFKGNEKDPRHTHVGAFLRKSYLDELPQIINIIKGEMSFIGPRPERPEYVGELKQKIPFYEMRLLAPPGITGRAQINMENDASVEDAPEKMQYDLYYIKNRSIALDLLILLRTLFAVLQRQGR